MQGLAVNLWLASSGHKGALPRLSSLTGGSDQRGLYQVCFFWIGMPDREKALRADPQVTVISLSFIRKQLASDLLILFESCISVCSHVENGCCWLVWLCKQSAVPTHLNTQVSLPLPHLSDLGTTYPDCSYNWAESGSKPPHFLFNSWSSRALNRLAQFCTPCRAAAYLQDFRLFGARACPEGAQSCWRCVSVAVVQDGSGP